MNFDRQIGSLNNMKIREEELLRTIYNTDKFLLFLDLRNENLNASCLACNEYIIKDLYGQDVGTIHVRKE